MSQPLSVSSGMIVIPPALSGVLNGSLVNANPSSQIGGSVLPSNIGSFNPGINNFDSASLGLSALPQPATAQAVSPVQTPVTPAVAASTPAAAATPAAPTASATQQDVINLVKSLIDAVKALAQQIGSQPANGAAPTLAANQTMSRSASGMAATAANDPNLSAQLDQLIVGGSAQDRADLKRNLMAMAQDPEGGKLVAQAIKDGTTFAVGDPAAAGAADQEALDEAREEAKEEGDVQKDGQVIIRGVTVTKGNGKSEITLADANNLKTLAHEMVHAATSEDGDSKTEEGLANVIGKRVEARLTGIALEDPNVTFANTLPNYTELSNDNGIENSLAALGLQGFV